MSLSVYKVKKRKKKKKKEKRRKRTLNFFQRFQELFKYLSRSLSNFFSSKEIIRTCTHVLTETF